jgi:glycosyltransferase involved in cell wall biosynthesis
MTALKGFPLLIEVARRLPRSLVHVVACVPSVPSGAQTLYEQAKSAGIEIRLGMTSTKEIFSGAALLLQCTDPVLATETFSLVAVEALANGVPVATAGMAVGFEVLGEARAFDVPSRDANLIAVNILRLLQNAEELERLRLASISRAQSYSFEKFKNNILTILDQG